MSGSETEAKLETATKALAERDKRIDELRAKYRHASIREVAARLGAVSADNVAKILADNVAVSARDELAVVDDRGHPQYNGRGEPKTLDELVSGFRDAYPFHFSDEMPSSDKAGKPDEALSPRERISRGLAAKERR